MIRKFNTFWSLESTSQRLFIQTMGLLPLVSLSLRLFGLKHTSRFLSHLVPVKRNPVDPDQHRLIISQTLQMLGLASRYCTSANCLVKSLVLWRLLLNQGLSCELQFGVKHGEKVKYDAHAWVEYKGIILNDRADIRNRFMVFDHSIDSKI